MDLLRNRFRWVGIVFAATLLAACGGGGGGSPQPPAATPPTVLSTAPAHGATGVAINTAITAAFSDVMTASTLTAATFTISGGVTGAVTYSGTTATFTPTSRLVSSTLYTATITTGVKDAAGNALASNYTWRFTTQAASAGNAGALDTTFNSTGKVTTAIGTDEAALAVAIQADGKIVAAGASVNGTSLDFALVRYNTNGSLDATFGTNGKVTTALGTGDDYALAVAIQADGKVVAVGFSAIGANNDFALVRYNTDGSLDATFDTDGKVTTTIGTGNDVAATVAIQADGRIVAAGSSVNGTNLDFALVRYNTNGSLDTTFGTDGKVTTALGTGNDVAATAAIQADGKIVAAGSSGNGTNDDFALVRYNTDGSLDTTFDTDGKVTTALGTVGDTVRAVAIQADGRIVAVGYSGNGTNDDFALVRYNADGSLDTTFDTDGKVTTALGTGDDAAYGIAMQANGKIVAAGSSSNGTNDDFALVRYNINGSLDATFDTDGKVTTALGTGDDAALTVAIQAADGKIVAAGSSVNGTNDDFALARYLP